MPYFTGKESDMKKPARLHELLAIEGDLKGEKDKVKVEAFNTFSKKPGLFMGHFKQLAMFDEKRENEQTEERQELTETVPKKLKYLTGAFTRYWDVKANKEIANQLAQADVEIDGQTIFTNLPVSFLLGMEEELKQLRKVYDAIPTLQPGVEWKHDDLDEKGVYTTAYPLQKNKTEKTTKHHVTYPATKEFPAQVAEWTDDIPIGQWSTVSKSGMMSPLEKSLLLGRLDKVIRAFKKARQRANMQETGKYPVGKAIFDFVHGE